MRRTESRKASTKIPGDFLEKSFPKRISGNLYTKHEDFIVEELHNTVDCKIKSLDGFTNSPKGRSFPPSDMNYIHATLVKRNLSTFEACSQLCEENHLGTKAIAYCGLKDTLGVTSQLICIPYLSLLKITSDRYFIQNGFFSKKKLHVGDHIGNRFIITVRNVSEGNAEEILEGLKTLLENGIPNFYGLQRFGVRQNNHELGKLLLKKNYEAFVYRFLTETANESHKIASTRGTLKEMLDQGTSYSKCLASLKWVLPEMADEKRLLEELARGSLVLDAIKKMNLADFFLHSYSSYLFNTALSNHLQKSYSLVELEKIGNSSELSEYNTEIYTPILKEQGVSLDEFRDAEFTVQGHPRKALLFPGNFSYSIEGNTVTLKFDLGKGEYASLVLDYLVDSKVSKLC